MNISVPEKLKAWVEERVADGSYSSVSDYVRDLMRSDQRYQNRLEELRVEIQAGIDSPVSEHDPFEHIGELRSGLLAKARNAA